MMFRGTVSSACYGEALRPAKFVTVSNYSACDQANFMKNLIGHAGLICNFFQGLRCRSYQSVLFYKSTNVVKL